MKEDPIEFVHVPSMPRPSIQTDDRVRFSAGSFSGTGTVLGLSADHVVRLWIILLDVPYRDERGLWRAVTIPESCIDGFKET